MQRPLIILGAGGHARVLIDTLLMLGAGILGITDRQHPAGGLAAKVPYLGDDRVIASYPPEEILLINGLGSVGDTGGRTGLFNEFTRQGYTFSSVHHPTATISHSMQAGQGLQVLAGAVIGPDTHIGENVIVNTRAIVEHDCRIGDHCHIASGSIVCGGCQIADGVHVGAGATIIQGIEIGAGAIIAAGAVVISNIEAGAVVGGVPARILNKAGSAMAQANIAT